MKNTAILFDLDGTLFDTGPDFEHIINLMYKKRNKGTLNYPPFRNIISAGTPAMVKHAFDINENDPNFTSLVNEFRDYYMELMGQRAVYFPGIEALLHAIKEQNIAWGIVTNRLKDYIPPFLKIFNLDTATPCLVGADTTAHRKPHPEPLLHAAKLLGYSAENCLYVGDYDTDIEAAKAAGMISVAVTWGYVDTPERLRQLNPDYLIDDPFDIIKIAIN